MTRTVFFVSDRTGITAETLGHGLLTQFEAIPFERVSLRFIDSISKARGAAERINDTAERDGVKPIVFSTLVDTPVRDVVAGSRCVFFDLFDAFIEPLERELGVPSSHAVGRSHGVAADGAYAQRMDSVNFALRYDDGTTTHGYDRADAVLLGVSRSGKTPTCLYLALRYGSYAANYPLTDDDLESPRLPQTLEPYRSKLFGLTIRPERLHEIRTERRPDSRYASLKQCQYEVRQAEAMYRVQHLPYLDTTHMSVEEIAANIIDALGTRG
jgi:regulator of PEP synthase PpsR (kinase-PPPase family)